MQKFGWEDDHSNQEYEMLLSSLNPKIDSDISSPNNQVNSDDDDFNNVIKRRRRLTSEEAAMLNAAYAKNPKPNPSERSKLAKAVGMTDRAIQIWFQNRRAKQRRDDSASETPSLVFSKPTKQATDNNIISSEEERNFVAASNGGEDPLSISLNRNAYGRNVSDCADWLSPPLSATKKNNDSNTNAFSSQISSSGSSVKESKQPFMNNLPVLKEIDAGLDSYLEEVFASYVTREQAIFFQ